MREEIILDRILRIRKEMAEKGWDGFYVTSAENHRYVSGFNNPDGQILITPEEVYVFADFRYVEAVKRTVPSSFKVIMPETGNLQAMIPYVKGMKKVAFEDEKVSYSLFLTLQEKLGTTELVPAGDRLTMIRAIKTRDEVDSIVKAQRIAEAALEHLLKNFSYNMTEIEVAAELEYFMKKNGSEDKSFDTIAVSGTNSSSPHGVPRNVKLEKGFLTLDYGAMIDGYHSDMTRTLVVGKADPEVRKVYETVLKAQCSAIEAMGPGKANFAMDKVARDIIDEAGYKGCFGHSLGHGVGLEIHEKPNLSPRSGDTVLHAGEVVTAEPGIYLEGLYGCRIEDMILICPNGIENLTRAPKALIEL